VSVAMVEFLQVIVMLALIAVWIWSVCAVVNFIVEVPKQLKRIADALERRNQYGK